MGLDGQQSEENAKTRSTSFVFILNPEEYADAMNALWRIERKERTRTYNERFNLLPLYVFWPAVAAIIMETLWPNVFSWAGTFIVGVVLTIVYYMRRTRDYYAKAAGDIPDFLLTRTHMSVSRSGVSVVKPRISLEIKWTYFTSIIIAGPCIVFRYKHLPFYFIPLNAFGDSNEGERFLAMAQAYQRGTEYIDSSTSAISWPPQPSAFLPPSY